MSRQMPFGPDELGPTELDDSLEAIRSLETVAADANVRVGTAFTDRVMGALANEPTPGPAGFLAPLRQRGMLTGFGESLRQAWASIGAGRPALARATSLAYVLVVVLAGTSLAAAATFGAAGALGLLDHETAAPSAAPTYGPTFETPEPSESAEPSESVEPSESAEPAETEPAEPTDDHRGGAEPTDDHRGGAEPTDDHGGSGSGGGGDDGSSGGPGPRPTDGGSDDSTGSGGGGGGD